MAIAGVDPPPPAASGPPTEIGAQPESVGGLVLVAIGWWLLVQLAGVPVGFVAAMLKHAQPQNAALHQPVIDTIVFFLAGCVMLIAVRSRSLVVGHGNRRAGVGDGPVSRWWLVVLLTLFAAIWAVVVSTTWNAAFPQWVGSWRRASPWTLIAFMLVTVILAPLVEELFYRGWLWIGIRRHWRPLPTAALTGFLWLIVHLERGFLVPIVLIPIAVMLGFTRHFCGVRAAIALHAVYNLVNGIVLVLLLTLPGS
jgi:membrane protease YdiL (CAAX protease family)